MLANDDPRPSEEHRGFEILYVTGERSWRYRADGQSTPSRDSYRSSFLTRRAVDRILDEPAPAPRRTRKS